MPPARNMPAPQLTDNNVAQRSGKQTANQATQQKGLPYRTHAIAQPVGAEFKFHVRDRYIDDECADPVGHVEDGRHGHRVCEKNQADRQGKIAAQQYGDDSCNKSLPGCRDKRHEQPDEKRHRRRIAVDVPEIAIVNPVTEYLQRFNASNPVWARHYFLEEFSWHI